MVGCLVFFWGTNWLPKKYPKKSLTGVWLRAHDAQCEVKRGGKKDGGTFDAYLKTDFKPRGKEVCLEPSFWCDHGSK